MNNSFNTYQHLSFDVWNTLLTANPLFTERRTQCISDHFKMPHVEAKQLYTQTKRFLDKSAEIGEICMSTDQCWQLLGKMAKVEGVDLAKLQAEVNVEFTQNLPFVNQDLINSLRQIKLDSNISMGILSNTNFITGETLSTHIFNQWEVFNFELFSDETLAPKPSKKMFDLMHYEAMMSTGTASFDKIHILHIGDNKICDGAATKFGMSFLHVNDPADLANKLTQTEEMNYA